MQRSDFLNLLDAALAAGQAAYARQAARRYLADSPGDLGAQLALARAYISEGETALAIQTLEALTAADPEDFKAQRLLGDQHKALGNAEAAALAYANAHVGDGLGPRSNDSAKRPFGVSRSATEVATTSPPVNGHVGDGSGLRSNDSAKRPFGVSRSTTSLPAWSIASRAAYLAERIGDWETVRRESESAVRTNPLSPLPSLLHLCSLWHAGQLDLALPLAEGFHARWPTAVAFKLCLAECLLKNGEAARALELLHDAAAQDLAGQVAARHWGENHPYRALWATGTVAASTLPGPLPVAVVKALGLNRINGSREKERERGQKSEASRQGADPNSASAHTVEALADIQEQLDARARDLENKQANPHAQRPITNYYLLLSSRTCLMQAYRLEGFAAIDQALNTLAASAAAHSGMQARVVYVDDPAAVRPFGLRPVNPGNAWDIKMLLRDLAARFRAEGAALGALLIVGGDDIIPFHRLPNPTDDLDLEVPSDNPYATSDENYFIPEWPVGRIPSGAGNNPALLLRALKTAAGAYSDGAPARSRAHWDALLRALGLARLWEWLIGRLIRLESRRSFGYSANVWKSASAEVYTTIGNPRELLTCPPLDANALPVEGLAPSRFSYFNLHGVEDGAEWYGQRGYGDNPALPEYPVALRPADVVNSGRAPVIVFSEACYGANILGKTVEDALCLRFLDSGTRALAASTKIAYGSVAAPLIGADLLGKLFWQNVSAGLPAGEALSRAKLQMAQVMHERQGFLDGEDQKTLLSFVLYGDPLTTAPGAQPPKSVKRWVPRFAEPPPPMCDRAEGEGENEISPEMVAHIKQAVARYLPGTYGDAQWRVAHTHANCAAKNHTCPTAQLSKTAHAKNSPPNPHFTVVTLSKTIRASSRAHPHYARVTLDEKGKVVKVAVSR